jgi:GNAT superfamily N-acetyltransferase
MPEWVGEDAARPRRKAPVVIRYRTFCNFDPPHYCAVWNDCIAGHRAPSVRSTLLDFFTLSKPYFDPAGVIFAEADGQPVGLAHAGFAPLPDGTGLDHGTGVLCVLGVVPDRRRQGVGSELLRRAEDYMRQRGATHFHAGPLAPLNPFTFGLYG